MPSLKSEEHKIYLQLVPLFVLRGYEPVPEKKQFRLATPHGYRCAMLSLNGVHQKPGIQLHLGVRFNLLETLLQQFLPSLQADEQAPSLILNVEKRYPEMLAPSIKSTDACYTEDVTTICTFMKMRGFRVLHAMDNIRRADGLLNRYPKLPSPYQSHPVQRCFRGLVLASLTHRTRFDQLLKIYEARLTELNLPENRLSDFRKLANFLQMFSFN